jgi:ComF family protein
MADAHPSSGQRGSLLRNSVAQLRSAGRHFLDLLYPPQCPGCGRVGVLFCDRCRSLVQAYPADVCFRCARPQLIRGLCPTCSAIGSSLEAVFPATIFVGPIRKAIHDFKYEGVRDLAIPLADWLLAAWRLYDLAADLIVPVPLHSKREAERGYNQSALLAEVLGRGVRVPVNKHLLSRRRATLPQVGLSLQQRHRNVEKAFACQNSLLDKVVVVVDDVCTTGATLEACAEVLRDAGAMSVWGFTLARARWDVDQASAAPDTGVDAESWSRAGPMLHQKL